MKCPRLTSSVLTLLLPWILFAQTVTHESVIQNAGKRADQSAQEIILIGEMHGTQETPPLFSNLVTVASASSNKRIGVGLELPIALQPLIDQAVNKKTDIGAFRELLFANPAWQKFQDFKDGRSSQAMLDLIGDLLRLAQSEKISFFFYDTQINDRNETMARFIGQRVRDQRYDVTFVLSGNIHANRAPRYLGRGQTVPMGYWLQGQGFSVHSYDVRYSEGETWACMPQCGIHHLNGYPVGIDHEGYDGILFVGPIHASPLAQGAASAKAAQ